MQSAEYQCFSRPHRCHFVRRRRTARRRIGETRNAFVVVLAVILSAKPDAPRSPKQERDGRPWECSSTALHQATPIMRYSLLNLFNLIAGNAQQHSDMLRIYELSGEHSQRLARLETHVQVS